MIVVIVILYMWSFKNDHFPLNTHKLSLSHPHTLAQTQTHNHSPVKYNPP